MCDSPYLLNEDDFFDRFPMLCDADGDTLRLEDYHVEPERTFLQTLDHHFIWTQVETDEGVAYLPGWHFVNRSAYLISLTPWTDEEREAGLACDVVLYDDDGNLIEGDPDDEGNTNQDPKA